MKGCKYIRGIIEIVQWFLVLFSVGICLYVYPMVVKYIENNKKNEQYKQIYYDRTIENLIVENRRVIDSLLTNDKDTVYLKQYIRVFDTVYSIKYIDFTTYDEIIIDGVFEEN